MPEPLAEDRVVNPQLRRIRVVRSACAALNIVCGLFAAVLALHIVLVVAEANPNNGFASFMDGWASGVSLGLNDLFTPSDGKLRVLFNEGLVSRALNSLSN